jgi:cation:H+ antiporter
MITWIEFIAVGAIVIYSGARLAFFADIIAEKTGMSRTWIGVLLLASMTSLPELVTSTSAVTTINGANIAIGAMLGSCVFNLAIIAILDYLYRPGVILSKVEQGHILAAGFSLVALVIVAAGIYLAQMGIGLQLLWIGIYTPAIFFIYYRGMRTIFRFETMKMRKEKKEAGVIKKYDHYTSRRAYGGFTLNAVIIFVTATLLPSIGNDLAEATGWGQTFIGVLFIALITSLPEVATSISSLRLGAIDLAIGSLLGSNLFNLAIIGITDIFFTDGPILAHINVSHMLPALSAILMSAIAILTLFYQPKTRRLLRITWLGVIIATIYVMNTYGVFYLETR